MQIKQAVMELKNLSNSQTPVLDAQVLCSVLVDCDKSYLYAHSDKLLTKTQENQLEQYKIALSKNIPLPYIIGEWEFYGNTFIVTPDTLIPRPETEELVEHALTWLSSHPLANAAIDVGTGSGCIAITIALQAPHMQINAIDVSTKVLEIAKKNSIQHNVSNQVNIKQQNLLTNDTQKYDLICANLPYIPTETLNELEVAKHEPWLALDGGLSGLDLIKKLLTQAKNLVKDEFMVIFEIENRQGSAVLNLAKFHYPDAHTSILKDLSKNDRFLVVKSK